MHISTAYEEFLLDQKINGHTSATIKSYNYSLKHFFNFVGNIETENITVLLCKRYVVSLQECNKLSSTSIQTYVRALRAFLNWLYNNEYIPICIPKKLKLPKAKKKVKDVLTEKEVDMLLNSFDTSKPLELRNLCIISLMLGSGCRSNEVATLRREHLHLNECYAIVDGKGNKQRNIPLSAFTISHLQKYLSIVPESEFVFLRADGQSISTNTIKLMFQKLKKKCNIPRLHAHLLRHTFATYYSQKGGDCFVLQKILGHSSLTMTLHYTHTAPAVVLSNFQTLCPI